MKLFQRLMLAVVFVPCLALSAASVAALTQRAYVKDTSPKLADVYPTVDIRNGKVAADKSAGVKYLTAPQREERRLVITQGFVYDHTGKLIGNTKSKHQNTNNYVMDAAGNFYLFDEFDTHDIRHSSILAGKPVAGAGNIRIVAGRITYIDSDSGHYPTKKVFPNVLKELESCGVDTASLAGAKHRGA